MKVEQTILKDCFIITDTIFGDNRGHFFESFHKQKFHQLTGLDVDFVQDNQSSSTKGVLRGLHFQTGEHAQAKLVRVLKGSVLDIAVDLRPDSITYGQYVSIVLSEDNQKQFFIPRGFGHGFIVLSDEATFFYKCDNFYHKPAEGGIIYNDVELSIDWQLPSDQILLSEKDLLLPTFNEFKKSIIK